MTQNPTDVVPDTPAGSTMVRDGSRVARNSILNLAGVIVPSAFAVLSTPFLLNNLGPAGFGIFSIQLAVLVLIGVNDFGVSRAVALEAVARGGFEAEQELRRVVWAGTHLIATVALGAIVLGGATFLIASATLSMTIDERVSWALLLPASAASLVTLPARAALEVQERFAVANLLRIGGSSLLFAAPALATFVVPSMTATSLAMLASRLLLSMAAILSTRNLLARPNWTEFFDTLRGFAKGYVPEIHARLIHRGGWLGSAGIASMLIGYVDRFALGLLAAATTIAHYVVASELVTKMWLVTGALASAMTPRLAHYWHKEGETFRRLLIMLSVGQLAISLAAHICFVFFGNQLLRLWLQGQYDPSMAEYLAILSIGIAINGISVANYLVLILHSRERAAASVQFVVLPLSICACIVAASFYGALGVAWVFSGRLLVDAFIIRALIPQNMGKGKGGVSHLWIALWSVLVVALYLISRLQL